MQEQVTTFEIERSNTGEILVCQKFMGRVERYTTAPTELHAEKIRARWVDEFWGINLNPPIINQLTFF